MNNTIVNEERNEVEGYFKSLQLTEWQLSGNFDKGGQALVIEVKNIKTGQLGVFRCLKRKTDKDIKRFRRELEILTQYRHSNIVEILDYTKDEANHWYISKKGQNFKTYWDKFREHNIGSPEMVMKRAIEIVCEICDGLIPLHQKGIIHRDIKHQNLVISNDGKPQLIDFGLTFVLGEERFTDPDEAVANRMSPDLTLNFLSQVPAWLDVYLLSQLLIWMTSEGTSKNYQRPLDWRWVIYPSTLSVNSVTFLRAITSICSNPAVGPRDANDLKNLISSLSAVGESIDRNKSISAIQNILRHNENKAIVRYTDSREMFDKSFPAYAVLVEQLEKELKEYCMYLKDSNAMPIEIEYTKSVSDWGAKVLACSEDRFEHEIGNSGGIKIYCGSRNKQKGFEISLFSAFHTKDAVSFPNLIDRFVLYVLLQPFPQSEDSFHANNHRKCLEYVFNSDGKFYLHDTKLKRLVGSISIQQIKKMISDWLTSTELWETM